MVTATALVVLYIHWLFHSSFENDELLAQTQSVKMAYQLVGGGFRWKVGPEICRC